MEESKERENKKELHKMIDDIEDDLFVRLLIAMIRNRDVNEKSNI